MQDITNHERYRAHILAALNEMRALEARSPYGFVGREETSLVPFSSTVHCQALMAMHDEDPELFMRVVLLAMAHINLRDQAADEDADTPRMSKRANLKCTSSELQILVEWAMAHLSDIPGKTLPADQQLLALKLLAAHSGQDE